MKGNLRRKKKELNKEFKGLKRKNKWPKNEKWGKTGLSRNPQKM